MSAALISAIASQRVGGVFSPAIRICRPAHTVGRVQPATGTQIGPITFPKWGNSYCTPARPRTCGF